jgi:hypothetical protein
VGTTLAATDFLTESRIRSARPKARPYKLRDGGGLYLLVTPANARLWRLRYKVRGRESMLGLGTYPATSLKAARDRRTELRAALEAGKDPAAERRAERANASNTFETIAREWLAKQPFAPKTLKKAVWTLEDLLFPYIGSRPVSGLTAPELLHVFRRLERRGKHETAHRARQRVSQVVRYAIATGRAERDPTGDLRGALTPIKATNRAAITEPREVAQLLRPSAAIRVTPWSKRLCSSRPWFSFAPGSFGPRSGQSSISVRANGESPRAARRCGGHT